MNIGEVYFNMYENIIIWFVILYNGFVIIFLKGVLIGFLFYRGSRSIIS